jgi:hypothetical protein
MAERSAARRYMTDRVDVAGILRAVALIVTAIALGALAAFAAIHLGNEGRSPHPAPSPSKAPSIAAPVLLQPAPAQDIAAFRAEKERLLETYGWIDREHGYAHIPIDRAMELLARKRAHAGATP